MIERVSKSSLWLAGCSVLMAAQLVLSHDPSRAHAQSHSELSIVPVRPKQIRVDGDLSEWRGARFARIGQEGESLRYALGYDDDALYIAARVQDASFIRTAQPSPREDAIVISLVAPQSGARTTPTGGERFAISELWLFAGIPGEQAAMALLATVKGKPRALKATIVEGPLTGAGEHDPGYVLEARLPWDQIPGSTALPLGRGAIRLHDVDDRLGSEPLDVATATGPFERLPELLFDGGPTVALRAFLADKGLPPDSAQLELFADVIGDPRVERVLIASTYVVVASAQLAGGFRFLDLPVAMASDVKGVELADENGDGKADIIVAMREQGVATRRVYTWDGSKIALYVSPQAAAQPAPIASTKRPAPRGQGAPSREQTSKQPAPPGMDQLVAAYREARQLDPSVRARFVTHVNVAEDQAPESLMLFDKELLIVGRGFRGGKGFFYFALPIHDGSQAQRMFTVDVTGDGRREVFVRVKELIGDVQREILLGYAISDDGVQPILATEVRRAQGERSIGNVVKVVGKRGAYALQISPGEAKGYTRQSYPFVTEPTDTYGALLLPWLDSKTQYRFDGERLNGR